MDCLGLRCGIRLCHLLQVGLWHSLFNVSGGQLLLYDRCGCSGYAACYECSRPPVVCFEEMTFPRVVSFWNDDRKMRLMTNPKDSRRALSHLAAQVSSANQLRDEPRGGEQNHMYLQ